MLPVLYGHGIEDQAQSGQRIPEPQGRMPISLDLVKREAKTKNRMQLQMDSLGGEEEERWVLMQTRSHGGSVIENRATQYATERPWALRF